MFLFYFFLFDHGRNLSNLFIVFLENLRHQNFILKLPGLLTHCAKVQKYEQGKIGLQFFICGANNVVEHYGKIIKILHGCPFEG